MADVVKSLELTAALSPDFQKAFKAASDEAKALGEDIKRLEKEQALMQGAADGDAKALKRLGISAEEAKSRLAGISGSIAELGRQKKELDQTAELNRTARAIDRLQTAYDKLKTKELGEQLSAMKDKGAALGLTFQSDTPKPAAVLNEALLTRINQSVVPPQFKPQMKSSGKLLDVLRGKVGLLGDKFRGLGKSATSVFSSVGSGIRDLGSELASNVVPCFESLSRLSSVLPLRLTGAAAAVVGLGAGAIKAAKAFEALGRETISRGDEIAKESAALGISGESYQKLAYAMRRGGATTEGFSKAIKTLDQKLSDAQKGGKESIKAFSEFGVTLKDIENKNPEEIFYQISDAIAAIDDPVKRAKAGAALFGEAGYRLTAAMGVGSEELRKLCDEAVRTGNVMTESMLKTSEAGADAAENLSMATEGLKTMLGASVTPAILETDLEMTKVIQKMGPAMESVGLLGEGLVSAWGNIKVAVMKSLAGLVIGYDAAVKAVAKCFEWLDGVITNLGESIMSGLVDGITGATARLQKAATGVLKSIPLVGDLFGDDDAGGVSKAANKSSRAVENRVIYITNNVDARGAAANVKGDVERAINAIPPQGYAAGYSGVAR